jgi:threonine dehydrogenase-like Zn-dependent dehydrogenase
MIYTYLLLPLAEITAQDAGAYASIVAGVGQLGLAAFLTVWLVTKAGPAERKIALDDKNNALAQQRLDFERWQKDQREGTGELIKIMSEAHGQIFRTISDAVGDTKDIALQLRDTVNQGFMLALPKLGVPDHQVREILSKGV